MVFNFVDLDENLRKYMVDEVKIAINSNNLYFSKRLTDFGISQWPSLLMEAVSIQNEQWLASQIESKGLLRVMEVAKKPFYGDMVKHIPFSAAETLAEGQFNRFYILGVCRRAIEEGISQVFVYRAKENLTHRLESQKRLGESVDPSNLLISLRSIDLSLSHFLLQPNSGLSIRL